MKYFKVLLLLVMYFWSFKAEKTMGPVGNIILYSLLPCEEELPGDGITSTIASRLKTVDDKGTKLAYINYTSKVTLDKSYYLRLQIFKWAAGWKPLYDHKGNLCRDIPKYLNKMYQKFANAMVPHMPQACPVPPGTYTLNDFSASAKDLNVPTFFYGRLLLKATVSDRNRKIVMCQKVECDSQAPV